MIYKTEDLVSSMKRSEFFPVSQSTFTDPDDLIAFMNEEQYTRMVPFMISNRQDYFLQTKTIDLTANRNHYPLPSRAIGNAFKDIFYVPDPTNQDIKYPIPKVEVHDLQRWTSVGQTPSVFHMMGDEIAIYPKPSSTQGQLMIYLFRRPNKLVPTSSCAKITAISSDSTSTTFTVDTDLSSSLPVGSLVDVLNLSSPFMSWADDCAITTISSTQIVVPTSNFVDANGVTELPIVGDYVCPAQTTCVPQYPQEFHPIIAEMGCFRILKSLKDKDGMAICANGIKEMLHEAFKLIENRIESEVDTIFEQNSILNAVSYSGYRFVTK